MQFPEGVTVAVPLFCPQCSSNESAVALIIVILTVTDAVLEHPAGLVPVTI